MNRLKFSDFLNEAPLPDDWDEDIYNERIPFTTRVKYATERAKRAGAGSSRIAFIIPYQGRNTILKVAKNSKGMAQNEVEAQTFEDWYLKSLNIIIPMIDYDERNQSPTWIHTELAAKIKDSDFIRITGANLSLLIDYAENASGRRRHRNLDFSSVNEDSDLVQSLTDFVGNFTHIPTGDLKRLANWGMYNGNPVIIDLGLDDTVMQQHYSRHFYNN
jgi:hypothetical protein